MFEKDYSTYDGCMELVEKIRRFWARKGLYPSVTAFKMQLTASNSAAPRFAYEIHSDMVGGWPGG